MKLTIRDQVIEVSDSDTWIHQQSGRQVISHAGVQKIAEVFKLEMLEPKLLISPSQDNGGLVAIQVAVKEGDRITYEIHEASDVNTTSVSRSYKVRMAFKRAYDKAILSHLGLYDVASDIETEDFSDGQAPKYQRKRKREAPKSDKQVAKSKSNGGASKTNGGAINPKILDKIEEVAKDLDIEVRTEFKDNEESIAYLNDLLSKFREAKTRVGK